jgi:hypothetical protein
MDKLHVFELGEYEKVLLLDTDIVVTQRLDSIFDDPAAAAAENLGDAEKVLADEAPQPATYIMAGHSGPTHNEQLYPAPREDRLTPVSWSSSPRSKCTSTTSLLRPLRAGSLEVRRNRIFGITCTIATATCRGSSCMVIGPSIRRIITTIRTA